MTLRRYRDPRRRQQIRDLRRAESCERKVPYDSHAAADAVRVDMTHGRPSRMAIYRCTVCGKYHIGSDKRTARKMK
jgi:hypothetical protein